MLLARRPPDRQAAAGPAADAGPRRPSGSRRLCLPILLGVLAQHAEQAAHLGQPGPGGVADRGEPLSTGRRQRGRGQPGRLRLHRDHRDVVGDHVMQFARDPGPLAAGQVIGQHPLGGLADGAVGPALLAGCPRHRGYRRERDRRRQQHRQHPGLRGRPGQAGRGPRDRHRSPADAGTGQHEREREERHSQRNGQDQRPGPCQPVRDHQQRGRPRDRHQLEQDQRQHGRHVHRQGRGDRPEQNRPAPWPAGRTRTSAARSAR